MVMIRLQIQAAIKEDIKNVLEESYWLEPEDITCKIFARKAKNGTYEIPSMPNDELCKLSHRHESGDAVNISLEDAGRIKLLLHY